MELSPAGIGEEDLREASVPAPTPAPEGAPEPEEWREIAGHPDYLVSSLGRVWSMSRIARNGRPIKGMILGQVPGSKGYLRVNLPAPDGRQHTRMVHQLVIKAFLGTRPEGQVCRHGPNGKFDNRASQLKWGTKRENEDDKLRDGTILSGEDANRAKLTLAIVSECRRRASAGEGSPALAAEFGVTQAVMSAAIAGRTWAECQAPTRAGYRVGTEHHQAKLTPEAVYEARLRYGRGESVCSMAPGYGVTANALQNAVNGKTWKSVPMPGAAA